MPAHKTFRASLYAPLIACLSSLGLFPVSAQDQEGVQATYYRSSFYNYGFTPDKMRLDGITHVYHFAGGINTNTGAFTRPNSVILNKVRDHCRARGVKFLGVVMNFNHTQFHSVVGNATKRAKLIATLKDWYRDERLDGIDIDFEHPVNVTEVNALGTFVSQLRDALGPRALIGFTMAQWYNRTSVPVHIINEDLDIVNIMSYDHGGEHASWTWAQNDMEFYRSRGVIDSRLVLGLPFYGIHVNNRDIKTYKQLLNSINYVPGEYQNTINGYFFNSRGLVINKVHLAYARGSGNFSWVMDQDDTGPHSLTTAMVQSARDAQATLNGFEYPPYSTPGAGCTLRNMTTESSYRRTGGLYGCRATMNFSGQPWANAQMVSPILPEFQFPSNATIRLDAYVENPTGALLIMLEDANGDRIRHLNYSLGSAGWKTIRAPRSQFTKTSANFDYNRVVKWTILVEGEHGGNTVAPYTRRVVFDTLALVEPGSNRPLRVDRDSNIDTVPDLDEANVCWLDRFHHGHRTTPEMIYDSTGSIAGTAMEFVDSTHYPGQRVLRVSAPFTGAPYEQVAITTPPQEPYAVNSDSVLHVELDVQTPLNPGTFRVDIIDADGNHSQAFHYPSLDTKGRSFLDFKASSFSGNADLSRLVSVRFILSATGSPHGGANSVVDIANICWGRLPANHNVQSLEGDQDNDGLSDAAEDKNMNGTMDPGETNSNNNDTDGDGTMDGDEMATGTDPMNPSEYFHATHEMINGELQITWPSKPGATYRIECSDTLDSDSWTTIADDIPAHASATSTNHNLGTVTGTTKRFYRVALK